VSLAPLDHYFGISSCGGGLIGVYCGSLRVRQAGGGENLLDPCVLAAAVLGDVRGGGTGPPLGGGVLLSQA